MGFRELVSDAERMLSRCGYVVVSSENILAFRREGDYEGAFLYLGSDEFATGPYVVDPRTGVECLVYDIIPYSNGRKVTSYEGSRDSAMAEHLVDNARIIHDLRTAN